MKLFLKTFHIFGEGSISEQIHTGLLMTGGDWLCLVGPKCGISTPHPTQFGERNSEFLSDTK
jgi:hypothetical protein